MFRPNNLKVHDVFVIIILQKSDWVLQAQIFLI